MDSLKGCRTEVSMMRMKLCLWLETSIHPTCPFSWPTLWILDLLLDIPQLHMSISYNESPNISHTSTISVTDPWLMHILIYTLKVQFSSGQPLSLIQLFATPWIIARQAALSITNSQSSLRLMSTESLMPSGHLILCRPLLLLPPIPPSIRVFSNESTLRMRWPKYCSFNFSIIPSKEIPGLIFRMDWLDLLAVQGTLKSLLQQHSSKASILWCSAFTIK